MSVLLLRRSADAELEHEEQMESEKCEQECRQHPYVDSVEPGECHAGQVGTSAQEPQQPVTDDGEDRNDPRSHRRGPIGLLIPWQQVPGETESDHDEEECDCLLYTSPSPRDRTRS